MFNGKKVISSFKVEYDENLEIHNPVGRVLPIHEKYGLCILGSSINHAPKNGYYTTNLRKFEFYSLSHLISGKGRLYLENRPELDIEVNDAVLICPGDLNRYGGVDNEPYHEEVIRFMGPVADYLRYSGVLKSGIYKFEHEQPLKEIIELAHDPSDSSQINANIQLQLLLVELYNIKRTPEKSDPIDQLAQLIKTNISHWYQVRELAEIAKLSPNQLRRNFLKRTGTLPKEYIEQIKLRKAAELLTSTSDALQTIAKKLGYFDVYHFSRRFKAQYNVSPGVYRNILNK